MENGNGNGFGAKFTFATVVRGELPEINALIEFLKASDLVIAHQQIGQNKMYIKEVDNEY